MTIGILKNSLYQKKMSLKDTFIMMHDNRPKYNATNTRASILYNTWKHLETPLQSPDINIIKNIGDHLKWEITKSTYFIKKW